MMLLVSGATRTVKKWKRVGELIVPAAGNSPDMLKLLPGMWAMDNGAYSGLDTAAFVAMLERFHGRLGCRWVAAPDAVGDAHQTLLNWPFWSRLIRGIGFRPALVLQDGMLVTDVPWSQVGAVFVGGTDDWKFSQQAHDLCGYGKARGLSVHVGRVNSRQRIFQAARMGADTFDGGQYSRWAERRIPEGVIDAQDSVAQQRLL